MKETGMKVRVGGVLCVTILWTACSTAWVGEAEQILTALIPATANLVTLVATLQGKNVSAADLQTIQNTGAQVGTDLQLMQSLITQYRKGDAAAQPALLNEIQAAISAAQSSLNELLPALHIKDAATQAKITAVVGILLSEVQSVDAIVPLVNGGTGVPTLTARTTIGTGHASEDAVGMGHPQYCVRAPLTASEFVNSYNATMTAKTGNVDLDHAAAEMTIHLHGRFARWASVGLLK